MDCIDLVACKVDLICQALERGIPIQTHHAHVGPGQLLQSGGAKEHLVSQKPF